MSRLAQVTEMDGRSPAGDPVRDSTTVVSPLPNATCPHRYPSLTLSHLPSAPGTSPYASLAASKQHVPLHDVSTPLVAIEIEQDVHARSEFLAAKRKAIVSRADEVKPPQSNAVHVVHRNQQQQEEKLSPEDLRALSIIKHDKSGTGVNAAVEAGEAWSVYLLSRAPGFQTGFSMSSLAAADNAGQARSKPPAKATVELESDDEAPGEADERVQELLNASSKSKAIPTSPEEQLVLEDDVLSGLEKQQSDEEERTSNQSQQQRAWAVLDESSTANFRELVPQLALEYPFELDDFQKRAVVHLERGESVFVAAHTSAGKTVVAEYAIALAFEHRTRIVYTSPIKALSNQKFRDFSEKFGRDKVGLLTGDNAVNPHAPLVVMTTEILRSMLYRAAEMIQDVEFVIFDEIHYVNDADRGVIWEETLILLPQHVHVVMLSATTPNTIEFSSWVGRNRKETVYVVGTMKRPVPLEHFLYVPGGDTFRIIDQLTGKFIPEARAAAVNAMRAKDPFAKQNAGAANKLPDRSAVGKAGGSPWLDMVKDLNKKKLLPLICFCFSKRQVESKGQELAKLNLLTASEKSAAHMVLAKALARLHAADRNLPQILRVANLLAQGVGIHHGGLLPILKEVVEICFTRGIVKVLIATETFAMGVNAPCRTVAFNSLRKNDGTEFRDLLPGEYTQMCGRAGRRGLDSVGTVLIICDSADHVPPLPSLSMMLSGMATKLSSKFRLRYSMILNLALRADNLSATDMLKRSFGESTREAMNRPVAARINDMRNVLAAARQDLKAFQCVRVDDPYHPASAKDIESYDELVTQASNELHACAHELLDGKHGHRAREDLLRAGRLVVLNVEELGLISSLGVVLGCEGESTVFVLSILADDFQVPDILGGAALTVTASAATAQAAAPAASTGPKLVARKRGGDDDDDEFAALANSKKKGKGGGGNAGNNATPAPKSDASALPVIPGPLPRFVFGGTQASKSTGGELNKYVVVRSALYEIEKFLPDPGCAICDPQTVSDVLTKRAESSGALIASDLRRRTFATGSEALHIVKALDCAKDLRATDVDLVMRWRRAETMQTKAGASPCATCPVRVEHRMLAQRVARIKAEFARAKTQLSDENLELFPDLSARLEVLRLLGYVGDEQESVDAEEAPTKLKGRVACEIYTCDELVLAEIVFDNVFEHLDHAECAALLSCLVLQQKCDDKIVIPTPNLRDAIDRVKQTVERLAEIQTTCRVGINSDWPESVFNTGLVQVVYEWARGRPFATLMDMTSLEEGIIVRAVTRLDETCREVKGVAKVIGDPVLLKKMEKLSEAIKRDIVFTTSLYVT